MRMRSALVVANPKKPRALKLERQVEDFLLERGVKLKKNADALVTIGGDGTILYNKQFFKQPVFGIGGVHSGICQAKESDWREKLGKAVERFEVEELAMLSCVLNGKKLEDALNEYAVKTAGKRILEFELTVLGKTVSFKADGLIASTPTGSTGYSYSCGGEVVSKKAREYLLTPIAPCRREFQGMILSDRISSELRVFSECPAHVVVDGQFEHSLNERTNMLSFKKSRRKLKFVKV